MSLGEKRLYDTLCGVLDAIREEAPNLDATYKPHPSNHDAVIQARSRALLHLFLKARFGLLTFKDREKFVTDGSYDGGIDAYYMDTTNKILYILQAKFRANAQNFATVNVTTNDLLKMDVKRVLQGELCAENHTPYNRKISALQQALKSTVNIGSYKTQVVLLGNLKNLSQAQIARLVDGYHVEQLAHQEIYAQLLFTVVNGTYYNDPNLTIEINLSNLRTSEANLAYDARTKDQTTNIKLAFVPTREIGRIMSKYRNSILKFNPRSFLELKNNTVNKQIESSIIEKTTNEFALFNNGITIIANETSVSSNTGRRDAAQLVIVNPQLVNGAQTAYTLARIFDRCEKARNFGVFKGKEVLLKVITFTGAAKDKKARDLLIGSISKASNSQTRVDEFDRRSNDPIQIALQHELFAKHGLFYERKRGEFSDGLHEGYISPELVVQRDRLVRVVLACGFLASQARASLARYSGEAELGQLLKVGEASKYAFGYEVMQGLDAEKRKRPTLKGDRYHTKIYGQALRYGQYAVVAVCTNAARQSGLDEEGALSSTLAQWPSFEAWVLKQKSNYGYIADDGSFGFVNYYKGATINSDLTTYKFLFPQSKNRPAKTV